MPFDALRHVERDCSAGQLFEISGDTLISPYGLAAEPHGARVWMTLGLDGGDVPKYGVASVGIDGTASGRSVAGYLPELLRTEGGVLLVGHVEGKGEKEIFGPVDRDDFGAPRVRPPANEIRVLSSRGDQLVRYFGDLFKQREARIVVDGLGPKGKRKATKLPKVPYPIDAFLDQDGSVHAIGWDNSTPVRMRFDASGALLETSHHDVSKVGPSKNLGPMTILGHAPDGSLRLVAAKGHVLGFLDLGPGGATRFTELFAHDSSYRFHKLWAPEPCGETRGTIVRVTFGRDEPYVSGHGWVVLREGRVVERFFSEGKGAYVDESGARHVLADHELELSHLSGSDEGTMYASFRDGRTFGSSKTERLLVLRRAAT